MPAESGSNLHPAANKGFVLNYARKLWQRGRDLFPIEGFHFDRPIVLLQSDDWGRAGLRDEEGLACLRSAGLNLGERPYDLYTLETADDLGTLASVLNRHHDSTGCSASIGMNFIVANLDFAKMEADAFRKIHLLPLAEGLPQGWSRPNLLEAYRTGIASGVFRPALHGLTHFCRAAVERALLGDADRASLIRTLWRAGTPYIHWRMPWIGYEYWEPEKSADERFLPSATQQPLIGQAVGMFTKLFSTLPRSACAPGYRANDDTHRAWSQYGVRVTQNGPGSFTPPHFDRHGLLHLYRTIELEPVTDSSLSLDSCVDKAETCFASGIPAVVSIHSINFHSSVGSFRDHSLKVLDQFFSALETRHSDLLYLCDEDLYQLVEKGLYETAVGTTQVNVTKKKFMRRQIVPSQKAG
jgi:hypothetical protein